MINVMSSPMHAMSFQQKIIHKKKWIGQDGTNLLYSELKNQYSQYADPV